jgi:RimJ/RimL family protein N-acetyltransferase
MNIRLLLEHDMIPFQTLHLRAVQEAPDIFGMTAEEFLQSSPTQVAKWLHVEGDPPERFILGAFDPQDNLVGKVGFWREKWSKKRHKASIWGMYVIPELRMQGIGKLLLQDLLRRSTTLAGLEQIHLSVVTTNEAARRLYLALGFRPYGLEHNALKHDDRYLDEELMVFSLKG